MDKKDLVLRKDGPTPHGGDYSELYYMNDDDEIVTEEEATHGIIRECRKDGTLIAETLIIAGGK